MDTADQTAQAGESRQYNHIPVLKCGCTATTIAAHEVWDQLSPIGADSSPATSLSLSIHNLLLYGAASNSTLTFLGNYNKQKVVHMMFCRLPDPIQTNFLNFPTPEYLSDNEIEIAKRPLIRTGENAWFDLHFHSAITTALIQMRQSIFGP